MWWVWGAREGGCWVGGWCIGSLTPPGGDGWRTDVESQTHRLKVKMPPSVKVRKDRQRAPKSFEYIEKILAKVNRRI